MGHLGGPLELHIGTIEKGHPSPDSTIALNVATIIDGITSLDYVSTTVDVHVTKDDIGAVWHVGGTGHLLLDNVGVTGWRAFTNAYGTTDATSWIAGDTRVTYPPAGTRVLPGDTIALRMGVAGR